jgi:TetR/AcrR family transcriptional regulator
MSVSQATEQAPATRERILDAAEDLFARVGYSGASVKMIAERVGVTGAMIHYYFQSKENLYRAVVDRIVRELEGMAAEITATRKPPVERLEIYLRWFFDYIAQHPNFSRLSVMGLGGSEADPLHAIFTQRVRPLYEMGVAFFETAIAAGLFRSVDVPTLLVTIYASVFARFADREFIEMITGADPADPAQWERQKDILVDLVFRILDVPAER